MTLHKRIAQAWIDKEAGSGRVLYHIAKKPAQPKPYRKDIHGQWNQLSFPPGTRVVYLTPDPLQVASNHGRWGNVYAYRVPKSVIRELGGMSRVEGAREIAIPDYLWDQVDFLGKSKSEKELVDAVDAKYTLAKGRGAWWAKFNEQDQGIHAHELKQNQAARAYRDLNEEIASLVLSRSDADIDKRRVVKLMERLRYKLNEYLYDSERKHIRILSRTQAKEAQRIVSKYRDTILDMIR